ncbi:MAG: 16S rRNA (cytosine(967)-C(5))-methyltransferase RsmB [Pyrinomonadaceae bacterium]
MAQNLKAEKNLSKTNEVRSEQFKVQSQKVSAARLAAFEILQKIAVEKAFSAILLPAYEENLKPEDRALCHELTLGILRNQTWLDAHIAHFSGKNPEKLDLAVRLALRIGLYQLKFLTKIPASAAVNESVNLVYLAKKRSAAGFANAVLRKSEREPNFNPLESIENPVQRLAVETSHPIWLLKKWQDQFGFDETVKLARINNEAPPTAFRITAENKENILEELQNEGAALSESSIVSNAWRISGATQKLRAFVAAGAIYLQDEASQLVAHIARINAGENFLDVCAAPGGKTTLVAALYAQTRKPNSELQSLLTAGDYTAPRIRILRETIAKYAPEKIAIVRYDATQSLPFADRIFDCVLVDAPCSGTGTIRHNPEIRWHLSKEDFAILAEKQLRIFSNAAALVKTCGRVIYSTCSLEPEEGEQIIAKFLSQNGDFALVKRDLPKKFVCGANSVRTFPPRDDTDGFFITVLERGEC